MAIIRVEAKRESWRDTSGNEYAVMDIQVDAAEDLPAKDAVVGTAKIQPGSTAQIVNADEPTFVTMNSSGAWKPEQS